MFIIYDLVFLIVAIFYLPIYLFRKKFHRGFLSRLGILPKNLRLNKPVWVHAVSVGEAKAIKGLVEGLRRIYPDKQFVISTVTPTGNKIAQGLAGPQDLVTYLSLDLSFIVKSVIGRINPSLFIIAETEIWPNLINCLYKRKIPVIIVNGRISDASFKGYMCVKFLLKAILTKIGFFCVQTLRDSQRLQSLGVDKGKIQITGNMKFDAVTDLKTDTQDYKLILGLKDEDRLLVAGSTHPGEEEIVLGAYKGLLEKFPNLKLLIAPRHPERSKDIAGIVSGLGLCSVFVSATAFECNCVTRLVFILDTIGQLVNFYNIADVVFVGGSLVKKGGQNILEPGSLGKPVLFGPHMFNFRDIADLFLSNKAAILVRNEEDLRDRVTDILNNPALASGLGEVARQLILQNQGATERNLQYIRKIIATS
jgi:3-deoxy-D-manno-octulosonic-acid transferase